MTPGLDPLLRPPPLRTKRSSPVTDLIQNGKGRRSNSSQMETAHIPAGKTITDYRLKGKMPKVRTLTDLIEALRIVFEEDNVNIELVNGLLKAYDNNPQDWKKYAKFDKYRYTRNLVDEGNGKYNLMLLCWNEGQGSAIHDHANAHCFMKVIYGRLSEVRFSWPEGERPMEEISRTSLATGSVCYINDSLGLHRVENPSSSDVAVSLHLYCPPFQECSVFNQQTGKRTKSKVTFWSKYGQKPDRKIQEDRPPEDN